VLKLFLFKIPPEEDEWILRRSLSFYSKQPTKNYKVQVIEKVIINYLNVNKVYGFGETM
jgi:hypothetical protein